TEFLIASRRGKLEKHRGHKIGGMSGLEPGTLSSESRTLPLRHMTPHFYSFQPPPQPGRGYQVVSAQPIVKKNARLRYVCVSVLGSELGADEIIPAAPVPKTEARPERRLRSGIGSETIACSRRAEECRVFSSGVSNPTGRLGPNLHSSRGVIASNPLNQGFSAVSHRAVVQAGVIAYTPGFSCLKSAFIPGRHSLEPGFSAVRGFEECRCLFFWRQGLAGQASPKSVLIPGRYSLDPGFSAVLSGLGTPTTRLLRGPLTDYKQLPCPENTAISKRTLSEAWCGGYATKTSPFPLILSYITQDSAGPNRAILACQHFGPQLSTLAPSPRDSLIQPDGAAGTTKETITFPALRSGVRQHGNRGGGAKVNRVTSVMAASKAGGSKGQAGRHNPRRTVGSSAFGSRRFAPDFGMLPSPTCPTRVPHMPASPPFTACRRGICFIIRRPLPFRPGPAIAASISARGATQTPRGPIQQSLPVSQEPRSYDANP
ncbi:hypothetical protein Bbelb_405350, partial [Branchiostoma belcheri]